MSSTSKGQSRILVMDANERNADLLSDVLADEGYEPVVVTDIGAADEAMEDPSQFTVAAIDLDRFENPVWSYCTELAEANVPYIVFAGIRNPTLKHKSKEHGADVFIEKPIPKREFINLIKSVIKNKV